MTKRTSYIFPELSNRILTADDVQAFFDRKVTRTTLRNLAPSEIEDIWWSNEWTRYSVCDECNQIHSRTYEGCDGQTEFHRFFKEPVTVWLE